MVIELKAHQEKVVDYLLNRCRNLRAMLIFHWMGTGKTITTLSFLRKAGYESKKKRIIVVCPGSITQTWDMEIALLEMDRARFTIMDYYAFMSLDLSPEARASTVLVMDECHNLCLFMKGPVEIKGVYERLGGYEKKLLLSGTPIYDKPCDLNHILNIVADSPVFPLDDKSFLEAYGTPMYLRSLPFVILKYILYNFQNLVLLKFIITAIINKLVKSSNADTEHAVKAAVIYNKMDTDIYVLIASQLITLILYVRPDIKDRIEFSRDSMRNFYSLDYAKIGRLVGRHVSFCGIPDDIKHLFPELRTETVYHTYSSDQLSLLVDFTDDSLSDSDFRMLMDFDQEYRKYARVFRMAIHDASSWRMAMKIGNTVPSWRTFSAMRINAYDGFRSASAKLKLKLGSNSKFDHILTSIKTSKLDDKVVVYSNFENLGSQLISAFLNENGVDHYYLDTSNSLEERKFILDSFNVKSDIVKRVLVLHPAFVEGITLIGVRQFHILEPIGILSKYEQVVARCRRMNSHMHLKERHRNVVVYTHVCDLTPKNRVLDYAYLFTRKFFGGNWWKVRLNEQYLLAYHDQYTSPDVEVFSRLSATKSVSSSFSAAIRATSMETLTDKALEGVCEKRGPSDR